ncbi:hypothetical protein BV25DRAFT_1833016 [Artomyces pyxidatus]|uniref:Uncharacterized protein n=1 Tax=Artomyces pyxidatus TaxID=48021 RepID=A0ACB8SHU3_9AGAM|nr:hypothetical protein BV25DRAFT_1833016 [Artomyces pyxidatus]
MQNLKKAVQALVRSRSRSTLGTSGAINPTISARTQQSEPPRASPKKPLSASKPMEPPNATAKPPRTPTTPPPHQVLFRGKLGHAASEPERTQCVPARPSAPVPRPDMREDADPPGPSVLPPPRGAILADRRYARVLPDGIGGPGVICCVVDGARSRRADAAEGSVVRVGRRALMQARWENVRPLHALARA